MRINTFSGLRGQLIEFRQSTTEPNTSGRAIVLRDDAPVADRPYSVHYIYEGEGGRLYAESGVYDLTLREAQTHFDVLTGREVS